MIFLICFDIALSHSGYKARIFPPQQGMERAACPFHTRMHVCQHVGLHCVCRRSLAVCLQPHLIGERLISVAVYGTVSQNMLYRMDGRVQFLLPIFGRLADTCSGASAAPYPVGTECVYAGVKGARPCSWLHPSHVSVLPHCVLLRQRNKPNVPDASLSMAFDYKLLYRSALLNKHDFMAVLPSSVLYRKLLLLLLLF